MEGDIGLCLQRRPDTRATEADVGGMAQLSCRRAAEAPSAAGGTARPLPPVDPTEW
jgi:hypothetical protein